MPMKSSPNCVKKLVDLHHVWQELQKNSTKSQDFIQYVFRTSQDFVLKRSEKFQMDLDNLFDSAQTDALKRMKIGEDKMFLHRRREQGRWVACLG